MNKNEFEYYDNPRNFDDGGLYDCYHIFYATNLCIDCDNRHKCDKRYQHDPVLHKNVYPKIEPFDCSIIPEEEQIPLQNIKVIPMNPTEIIEKLTLENKNLKHELKLMKINNEFMKDIITEMYDLVTELIKNAPNRN